MKDEMWMGEFYIPGAQELNELYEDELDKWSDWFEDVPKGTECTDPNNSWCNGSCAHCSSAHVEVDWNEIMSNQ